MVQLIAGEFSILANDVLDIGRAIVDLIQDAIDLSTPRNNRPGGGGDYPFS
ncbi:hypothetical protein [Nocardia brasiliensis]|uniref:hypothetical protein n=1 Tax=Nocardia brasiliensis TaxID=37326 RepID=UPI00366C380E